MSEFVVQANSGAVPGVGRSRAVMDRLGRTRDRRSMEAGFDLLVALRDRGEPVGPVRMHVCRHDEGVPDCSGLVVEG